MGLFPDEEAGANTRPSLTEEGTMPIVFIEAPAGVRDDVKKRMVWATAIRHREAADSFPKTTYL
jgi:hypothetical protein